MSVTLPESAIAALLMMLHPRLVVGNDGVGGLIVNGRRWLIPRECSEADVVRLAREMSAA